MRGDEPAAAVACDCIASGNPLKPKQHGADPHAKNCAIYTAEVERLADVVRGAVRAASSHRRTYRFIVSTSIEVDDERLAEVERLVQEQVSVMYHRMAREDDIRIVLQHQCEVTETP